MEEGGGARRRELVIHWRMRRAWERGGRRKGEAGEDQGKEDGNTGEEGEVEVALLSELVGEERGGEGGGREPGLKCVREEREGREGSSVLFL